MIRTHRLLAACMSALCLAAGPALVAASAQEQADAPFLEARAVDARPADRTDITVAYAGDPSALDGAVMVDDGQEHTADSATPLTDTGVASSVVIVIDNSELMDAALTDVKRAAMAYAESLPANTEIAVVGAGGRPIVARDLTTRVGLVTEAIDGLVSDGQPLLWDGVKTAADLLAGDASRQPNMILFTGTADAGSTVTGSQARGDLSHTGAGVQLIGLETELFDPSLFASITEISGGQVLTTADSDSLVDLADVAAVTMSQHYVLSFTPVSGEERSAVADATIRVADSSTTISYPLGSLTEGAGRLIPQSVAGSAGIGFLANGVVKIIAIAMALVAATLGGYALIMIFQRDDTSLNRVLQPYADGFAEGGEDDEEGVSKTALIQRAVDMTEEFAEKQGFLTRVEGLLERADLPLRAAEALFFYAAATALISVLALVISGNLLVTVMVLGLAAMGPIATVNFLASRRQKAFVALLPDTLQLLAGTLRAGYSLMQGVEAVSREVDEPVGAELRRVVTEARLGRPLEDALDSAAERMESEDFAWAVMAIRIQREVGGNLAELLLTVGETMIERERLRRDIAALTAEGKISAIVLGLLPPGLGMAMFIINPEYIGVLFSETIGNIMLAGACVWALFGFFWMKKTIEIEI